MTPSLVSIKVHYPYPQLSSFIGLVLNPFECIDGISLPSFEFTMDSQFPESLHLVFFVDIRGL